MVGGVGNIDDMINEVEKFTDLNTCIDHNYNTLPLKLINAISMV